MKSSPYDLPPARIFATACKRCGVRNHRIIAIAYQKYDDEDGDTLAHAAAALIHAFNQYGQAPAPVVAAQSIEAITASDVREAMDEMNIEVSDIELYIETLGTVADLDDDIVHNALDHYRSNPDEYIGCACSSAAERCFARSADIFERFTNYRMSDIDCGIV